MLGKSADHFMMRQMREKITAVPSNAAGSSLQMPDRERAGTSRFTMAATINPGPDNALASGWMPGAVSVQTPQTIALSNGYRPGAEAGTTTPDDPSVSAYPEDQRFRSFLGEEPAAAAVTVPAVPFLNTKTLMIMGGLAIGAYILMKKKSRRA